MASQITSLMIVYSTVYSGADQRKHQSSASLALVRGIHRWPVNSPHKWSVTRKIYPFWWRHHDILLCNGTCHLATMTGATILASCHTMQLIYWSVWANGLLPKENRCRRNQFALIWGESQQRLWSLATSFCWHSQKLVARLHSRCWDSLKSMQIDSVDIDLLWVMPMYSFGYIWIYLLSMFRQKYP